jgi:hypothetical protein
MIPFERLHRSILASMHNRVIVNVPRSSEHDGFASLKNWTELIAWSAPQS